MARLEKIQDDHYEILDNGEENFHHIHLTDKSLYSEVVFQFGKVQLLEENDSLRVKFEYEVFRNPLARNTNSEAFREYIGQILMGNLEELLIYNRYKRANS